MLHEQRMRLLVEAQTELRNWANYRFGATNKVNEWYEEQYEEDHEILQHEWYPVLHESRLVECYLRMNKWKPGMTMKEKFKELYHTVRQHRRNRVEQNQAYGGYGDYHPNAVERVVLSLADYEDETVEFHWLVQSFVAFKNYGFCGKCLDCIENILSYIKVVQEKLGKYSSSRRDRRKIELLVKLAAKVIAYKEVKYG